MQWDIGPGDEEFVPRGKPRQSRLSRRLMQLWRQGGMAYGRKPCNEALEWASQQHGSFQEAWDACPDGEWMCWLLRHIGGVSTDALKFAMEEADGVSADAVRHVQPNAPLLKPWGK